MNFISDFFIYEVDFTAGIAAGTTGNSSFTVQADSDFKLLKTCYFADIAVGALTDSTRIVPLATVLITDQGSGRQLMSAATPIPNIFGTGQIPFILPVPKIFAAKSTVGVSVVNFSAASTYNIRLSFIGVKLFKQG